MAKKGIATLALEGATVIINGVERDSFCAEYGTQINWSVSKEGYESQSGSFTLTEDRTIDVVLVPITTYVKFEIVATPSDATVLINGEERTSIEVESGTTVTWSVSKEGYESQSGSQVVTADTTKEIVLEEVSGQYDPLVLTIDNSNGMQTPQVRRLAEDTQTFGTTNPVILACFGGSMDVEVNGTLYEDVLPTEGEDYTLQGLVSGTNVLKFYPRADGEKFIFNYAGYTDATLPNAHIVSIDDWGDSRFSSLYYAFYNLTTLKSVAKPSKSKTFADLTNVCAVFYGATGLESLPEGFLADAGELEDATYFAGKSGLKALPNNLFNANAPVDLSYGFYQCPIEEVPAEWMKGAKVTNIYAIFSECQSLTTVGAAVFKDCTACETIDFAFGASEGSYMNLTAVGESIFEGCESVTSAEATFQNCGYDSIPAKTFKDCKALFTITNLFYGVTIKEIGESAFEGCESITSFSSNNALDRSSVEKVGSYAFAGCKSILDFSYFFSENTNLVSVGAYAFKDCTAVQTFSHCFYNVYSLETIGEGLFENCISAVSFQQTFYNCQNLASIPTGLFKNCQSVATFYYCFYGCTGLTSIPTGLFDDCTKVTTFEYCFYYCSGLTSIPTGLFDNCTNVTTFENCFRSCTGLTSIPAGLFDNNTAVTTFAYCFYGCTGLTSIPTGLFDNCTNVTTFAYCFYRCSGLTSIPENLFINNTAVTAFNYCFECSSSSSANLEGESAYDKVEINGVETIIHLYERENYPSLYTSPTSTTRCYRYQTKLEDYDSIPSEWK